MKKLLLASAVVAIFSLAFSQTALAANPSESSIMGYIAAISRSLDMETIPFHKLAQQYIWNGPALEASDAANLESKQNERPYIMVGGYWDTELTYEDGGQLTLLCYVMDPNGHADIKEVRVYFGGMPTAVLMKDDGTQNDFAAGDGVYGWSIPIPPLVLPAGQYLLEIAATDMSGEMSDIWPYLTIN